MLILLSTERGSSVITNEFEIKLHQPIIEKIKERDLTMLFTWMEQNKNKYFKIGWAYLRNQHDVEDIMQNTILKVYENIEQLNNAQYFESWVTTIFINECRKVYRQKQRLSYIHIDQTESAQIGLERLHIFEGLEKLEEKYKEVIILKYISGYTQEEIGHMLDLPIGTVKTRIYRGLRMMRADMVKGGGYHDM